MWGAVTAWLQHVAASAPEIFIFLAIAIGTLLGRIRFHGFTLGATACTLIVAVVLGQFGAIVIPPLLKSIFFGPFVFTIGYRSGPEFFASLSVQTLAQVVLALVMGASGLTVILIFAHALFRSRHLPALAPEADAVVEDGQGLGRVGAAWAAG